MNQMQPIKDSMKVKCIADYLKKWDQKYYIIFIIGIYTGLKISDILRLKVEDVFEKDFISIKNKKTGIDKLFTINTLLKKEIYSYICGKSSGEYIIKSRKGKNMPLGRGMAFRALRKIGNLFDLPDLGTETLRKTFGYHYYLQFKDVLLLKTIFNHSSPTITLRYIGYEKETMDKSIKNFKIF